MSFASLVRVSTVGQNADCQKQKIQLRLDENEVSSDSVTWFVECEADDSLDRSAFRELLIRSLVVSLSLQIVLAGDVQVATGAVQKGRGRSRSEVRSVVFLSARQPSAGSCRRDEGDAAPVSGAQQTPIPRRSAGDRGGIEHPRCPKRITEGIPG